MYTLYLGLFRSSYSRFELFLKALEALDFDINQVRGTKFKYPKYLFSYIRVKSYFREG